MSYYTVKPQGDHYVVSHFDGHPQPENQYHVWMKRPHCTCPGYPKTPGHQHKHLKMVQAWLDAGSPWFVALDIVNGEIVIYRDSEIKHV